MIRQTVLPFKLEMTNDLITSHAGLAVLGEFAVGLGLNEALDRYLPGPGSGAGYLASEHVFPIVLMLNGGGRSLEDNREIREDVGLREILPLRRMPCGQFEANAVFFRIGVLAYNIGRLLILLTMDESWHRHQVQTLRWKLYGTAGKIVFHGRAVYLKVSRSLQKLFSRVRLRSWEFAQT